MPCGLSDRSVVGAPPAVCVGGHILGRELQGILVIPLRHPSLTLYAVDPSSKENKPRRLWKPLNPLIYQSQSLLAVLRLLRLVEAGQLGLDHLVVPART